MISEMRSRDEVCGVRVFLRYMIVGYRKARHACGVSNVRSRKACDVNSHDLSPLTHYLLNTARRNHVHLSLTKPIEVGVERRSKIIDVSGAP